jgi:hypothetical protein
MCDQLAHPVPPDPRTDIAVTTPSVRPVPHRDNGVLDRIRNHGIVEAPRAQPRDQPRDVPVIQTAKCLDIIDGDRPDESGVIQPRQVAAARHRHTVARSTQRDERTSPST